MQLGMVGLGRMGAGIVRRLQRAGHHCVGYDLSPDAVESLAADGMVGASRSKTWPPSSTSPRAAWLMVPAGEITDKTIDGARARCSRRATSSSTAETATTTTTSGTPQSSGRRASTIVDIGTSGGVWGLERGFCLMIGGEDEVVDRLGPIFAAIAPGVGATARTPGRTGDPRPSEQGWYHCGPNGAGHFVKMVHNGIEYGLMAAYAEGLNIIANADAGLRKRDQDAETAPLRESRVLPLRDRHAEVAEVWRRGSVISSWLLDLAAEALLASPQLEEFAGRVSDSGEGRWTTLAAIEEGVPAPVLTAALYSRFSSRGLDDFADKLLSAMRKQFGGHDEKRP